MLLKQLFGDVDKKHPGWPEVLGVIAILLLTACGGNVQEQQSDREPQVYVIPTDSPDIYELYQVPPDGTSNTINTYNQPILNATSNSVSAQCAGIPSISNTVKSGGKLYDYVDYCQMVTVWKSSQ